MADISKIKILNGQTYNLKDESARTALANKINSSEKGANGGVAELDANGKVPASRLPSYVDDVLEYANKSSFPSTGETGKIYVDISTNKTYRWGGSEYAEISASIALGETSATAYRGDRGKVAYDHSTAKGSAYTSGLYKITTNAEGHVTNATSVAKSDITALGIPETDTTYSDATTSTHGLMSASDKTKLDSINGVNVYYVEGPSTDTTAGKWTGTINGLTEYYDGLTVLYVPAKAGASTTTLNINGLGAKTCYYTNTTKLTTHFTVGTPILFTYRDNAWRRADYTVSNTDTKIRIYRQTTGYDNDYPLVASRTLTIGTAGSNDSYTAVYGVIGDVNFPTVNPSTGLVKFKGLTVTDTISGSISGNAGTVNGHTVDADVPSNAVFTDTKNTAGSTDSSSKLFLIGATSQAANPQTYSHDTAYVDTDGCLYSGGSKVITVATMTAITNAEIDALFA